MQEVMQLGEIQTSDATDPMSSGDDVSQPAEPTQILLRVPP
jgi:hypothetical protein